MGQRVLGRHGCICTAQHPAQSHGARAAFMAEPHHNATPHWHALLWCESEADAQALEAVIGQDVFQMAAPARRIGAGMVAGRAGPVEDLLDAAAQAHGRLSFALPEGGIRSTCACPMWGNA